MIVTTMPSAMILLAHLTAHVILGMLEMEEFAVSFSLA